MKKQTAEKQPDLHLVPKLVRLVSLAPSPGGAYVMNEYEMPSDLLEKHFVKSTEPDFFAILITNLTKWSREVLGI